VVVVAIEYAWTGVRSGTNQIRELEQPTTIAVICIILMKNAIINSAVQLGWTAVNSQGAVNKQGVDMTKDAGKIKRKTRVMCTMFDTQLMDQSRHDWRRRESTYVDKTRTIIEKKWPHYISPRFGQTGSISATWISGRSEKPSSWQNKRVWMGKAGGGG